MPFTIRGTPAPPLLVALAAGLLLARLGPFDTFSELPGPQRAAYWIGLTLLLAVQILVALRLLGPALGRLHWAATAALSGLAGAVPSAFEVAWAESFLRVERDLGPVDVLALYGDVALIAVPLALAMRAVMSERAPGPVTTAPGGEAGRILSALSPERRGVLLALAAEDHYLRVYTDRGEELILRRFGDALADVAGIEGVQVHRGWWVARAAVAGSEREGDRTFLSLTNGVRVPVSRTYLRAARESGLLND